MTRNAERDEREAELRRSRLIEAGFELFSEKGIDAVSLSAVAKRANVAEATMYKYFQSKVNLAVAISGTVWKGVLDRCIADHGAEELASMGPRQLFEVYADVIISCYQNHPQILRFSGDYKTFIRRKGVSGERLNEHLEPLKPIEDLFIRSFEPAVKNGTVRADVPADKAFSFLALTMLAMAERYAQGIVWTSDGEWDHTEELVSLKNMLCEWIMG